MVQFFKGSEDPRGKSLSNLASALGMGIGERINSFYADKALNGVLEDESMKDAPISAKMGKLESALRPYGKTGQQIFQNRMAVEQQGHLEKQEKEEQKRQKIDMKKGDVLRRRLQREEISEEERALFSPQEELAIAKHEQAIELQKLKNEGKSPAGGVTAQPVPPDVSNKINKVLKENPNASSDELRSTMDAEGIAPIFSNPYTENRRKTEEQKSKIIDEKTRALRQETLPVRKELADKATAATQGIKNKEHLLDLIEKGDIDDPTYAALAESLPLNLGKRMLSKDTIEYKAGMIEEFKDLKNIFPGQIRVKEIELLEQKMADLYLTDDQKKAILNSRINALKADIIRAEAAQEIENEPFGVLQFQQEVEKRAQPKLDALFNQILDEQKSIIQNAENRKKVPLDLNDSDDKKIAESILKEAGGNRNKAREIAKKKGYTF